MIRNTKTVCSKCGSNRRYLDNKTEKDKGCADCRKQAGKIFRTTQRERKNAQNAVWRKKWKDAAFAVLGNKCVVCGFSDIRALQIDHVNGDGNIERYLYGSNNQTTMFKQIVENPQVRSRYQILCANHNWIKRVTLEKNKPTINKKKLERDALIAVLTGTTEQFINGKDNE